MVIFDYLYVIALVMMGFGFYLLFLATLQMIFKKWINKTVLEMTINAMIVFGLIMTIKIVWMWDV